MAVLVVGIGVQLGEPDDLLGVDGLAVDDSGNLPVGAACVKADAAALHVTAHGLGGLVGGGALGQGLVDDLQLPLVELEEEGVVEITLAALGVGSLQPCGQGGAAADGDPEAADGPQQELDVTLHIAVVGLGHFGGAVDEGLVDGNLALVALNGDGDGLLCAVEVSGAPDTEGDEALIQLRSVLHFIVNA